MEIEIKFRVEFEDIRRKIEGFGVLFIREEVQEDFYFFFFFFNFFCVRKIFNFGKVFLMYKFIQDFGRNEEFDEFEVEVFDFEIIVEIFKRLGFEEDVWIRKRRFVYKFDDVIFELSDVEGLGVFFDIEVMSKDVEYVKRRIWEIVEKFGFSEKDVEFRFYQEFLKEKI